MRDENNRLTQRTCIICQEPNDLISLACGNTNNPHEYHEQCIRTWAAINPICPLCKAPLAEDDIEYIPAARSNQNAEFFTQFFNESIIASLAEGIAEESDFFLQSTPEIAVLRLFFQECSNLTEIGRAWLSFNHEP